MGIMKATELRIGNLVSYRGESDCIVSNLGNSFEALRMIGGNLQPYGSDDIREFKPIPLTEEWLLKFGFERYGSIESGWFKRDYTEIYQDTRIQINVKSGSLTVEDAHAGIPVYISVMVKEVNLLQNLIFALTGEELEVQP
jgi:hypothetical protein